MGRKKKEDWCTREIPRHISLLSCFISLSMQEILQSGLFQPSYAGNAANPAFPAFLYSFLQSGFISLPVQYSAIRLPAAAREMLFHDFVSASHLSFLGFNHLFHHITAHGTVLAGSQVTVVAFF
jgi:hypothetical protein